MSSDALAFASATFGVAVVKAALPAFVAHRYGYRLFGELAAAFAIAQAGAIFFELGISEWVLYAARRHSTSRPRGDQILSVAAMGLALGALAGAFIWWVWRDSRSAWISFVPPLLCLNALYAGELVCQAFLRANFRVKVAAACRGTQLSANLIFFAALLYRPVDLGFVLWALVLVETVILGLFVRAAWTGSSTAPTKTPRLIEVFREYLPFALSSVAAYAYISSDAFLLAVFRPATEVGDYTAAYRLYMLAVQIVAVFAGTTLPLLYGTTQRELQRRLFKTASSLQVWIGIVGAAFLFLTAPLALPNSSDSSRIPPRWAFTSAKTRKIVEAAISLDTRGATPAVLAATRRAIPTDAYRT